jgi:CRISPR/Cas system-associated exonuclease Cas4 (RecB family)
MQSGALDRYVTVGDFFKKAIVVPGRKFVDKDLAKLYLYRALEQVDVRPLGLGEDFVRFFKDADFVLDFFGELAKERVEIAEIERSDTYAEYSDHLAILERLQKIYGELLERDGLVDRSLVREFEINEPFFDGIEGVELEVSGYLSRFERDILERVPVPVELRFAVGRYNKALVAKMLDDESLNAEGIYRYDFKAKKVLEFFDPPKRAAVESASFSERIWQVHYVLASVQEFLDRGCDPERIAVIVPDESFAHYLKLFDHQNLNFAMGLPFAHSALFVRLKALYDYLVKKDDLDRLKAGDLVERFESGEDLLEMVREAATERELVVIEEELFRLSKLLEKVEDRREQLHFILERLKGLAFDDTEGGKVTVMGVLESRGMEFDGVVIVDFNEEKVPRVAGSDMFLSSKVRERSGLPTRKDKEALQKHYYDQIIQKSRYVRIAYVQNEKIAPSRFLYELGVPEGAICDEVYDELLFRFSPDPEPTNYDDIPFDRPTYLTPTMLGTLLECPKQYYFKYVLRLANDIEDDERIFGQIFHDALARLLSRRQDFGTWREYHEALKSELFRGLGKDEIFGIEAERHDQIEWFCRKDFPRLGGTAEVEFERKKRLGPYTLAARCDRLEPAYAIDYKTGRKKESDRVQALFYRYIFGREPLFYYLKDKVEARSEHFDIEDAESELENILDSLECVTRDAEDEKACEWCEYRFMCKREV